jgi:hypothetical protein
MANEMFKILNPGEQAGFSVRDERTAPQHPYLDAPLDSLRNWANRPNAHENIDTLMTDNKNKDFFELMKGMIPKPNVAENFHPMIGAQKLIQMLSGSPQEANAFFKGAGQSLFGEPDPVGPQGLPFSDFLRQKRIGNNEKSRQDFLETVGPSSDWEQFGNILQSNPGPGYGYKRKEVLDPKVKSIAQKHVNDLFKK